jgi:hypothetical protein
MSPSRRATLPLRRGPRGRSFFGGWVGFLRRVVHGCHACESIANMSSFSEQGHYGGGGAAGLGFDDVLPPDPRRVGSGGTRTRISMRTWS